MNKLRLFHLADGQVERQPASLFRYEQELQVLLEKHSCMTSSTCTFSKASETFATDSGYIDTLGIEQ